MIYCVNSVVLFCCLKDIFNGVCLGIVMYGLSFFEELKEVLLILLK